MSLIVDVKLWGQNVGSLVWNEKQEIAAFQYEPKFLRSKLDISPLMMPLKKSSEDRVSLNPQLHSRSATYIKRNGLLIRKITIKSSRPFQCAYHPLTP